MQDYVIAYFTGMGFDVSFMTSEDIPSCEMGCGLQIADVHHIDRRGMGGSKKKYCVEEMMGMCREEHQEFGDVRKYRSMLWWFHFIRMKERNIEIDYEKLPKDLFFEQYSDDEKLSSGYYAILIESRYVEVIHPPTQGEDGMLVQKTEVKNRRGKIVASYTSADRIETIKGLINQLI